MSREPTPATPEILLELAHGRLEQMCPDCGRWDAAGFYCSWCLRVMGPGDWYAAVVPPEVVDKGARARAGLQSLLEQRSARMPKAAPLNPPPEYRRSQRDWPKAWGPWPGVSRT